MHASNPDSQSPAAPAADAPAPREHFIPIRKADLVRLLAAQLPAGAAGAADREKFLQLCRLLEATFHFEYHQWLEDLKDAYASFDPDSDTRPRAALSAAEHGRQEAALFEKFTALLKRANYVHISKQRIEEALDGASDFGLNLHVDLEAFERLEVYARGEVVQQRSHRRLKHLYRQRQVDVPQYQRLVIAFRPKHKSAAAEGLDADTVYMKIFKSIPKMDMEMLLPGTKVRMGLMDRGRIFLPAMSGMAITLYKLFSGALVLAIAGTYGLLSFLGLLGGTFGYGIKSFLSYLRAKDKYQLNLTRSLYYQNLDNNAGVLFRLLDEAEEQELRETVLAYHLLRQHDASGQAHGRGLTSDDLDQRAEQLLRETAGIEVDFEVDDALEKLERLGLVVKAPQGGLAAVPIEEALRRLDETWDGFFQFADGDGAKARAGKLHAA